MNTQAIEQIELYVNGEMMKTFPPEEMKQARRELLESFDETGKTCYLKYVPKSN